MQHSTLRIYSTTKLPRAIFPFIPFLFLNVPENSGINLLFSWCFLGYKKVLKTEHLCRCPRRYYSRKTMWLRLKAFLCIGIGAVSLFKAAKQMPWHSAFYCCPYLQGSKFWWHLTCCLELNKSVPLMSLSKPSWFINRQTWCCIIRSRRVLLRLLEAFQLDTRYGKLHFPTVLFYRGDSCASHKLSEDPAKPRSWVAAGFNFYLPALFVIS